MPLGARGTPCAPRGHAGRAASRPRPDRGALGNPSEKRKAGPASPASARTLCAPSVHTARPGTFSDVQHARPHGAQNGASHGAQNGASPGAQNRASPGAQNRASLGAQSGVSLGTRIARLPARKRHASAACEVFCFLNRSVWTLVWLLCDLLGWATFALNHRFT